jgi:hypothetical protein
MKKEKETDTEFLARLIAEGFARNDERFESIENQIGGLATKEELKEVEEKVISRCDRIENILYRGHDNRVENIEDKIAQIQVILGKKLV